MTDTRSIASGDQGVPEGLSNGQREVVDSILRWYADGRAQEFYLAGFAGTGKTTIAAHLIRSMGLRTCVAAYTGKAASVLRRKGIDQASTIHSLIYAPVPGSNPVQFVRATDSPLADARLLIIDEISMVTDELADDLRAYGKKILVLGDPGQLPPVGPGAGAFTRRPPDAFLTEIHRQAAGSPVLKLATAARLGQPLVDEGDDGRIARLSVSAVLAAEGQVICGTHRSRWGATKLIREKLGYGDAMLAEGERVICRRNGHGHGLYNGMLGTVEEVYDLDELWRFRVRMDDLASPVDVSVDPTLFREHRTGRSEPPVYARGVQLFDYGWVLTCHSSQGSEWPEVTIVDDSGSFRDDSRRWLYTALTRAAERVTLLRR